MESTTSVILGTLLVFALLLIPVGILWANRKDRSPSPNPPVSSPSPRPPVPSPSPNPPDALLQSLWRGKGLLNTSLSLQQACPGYFDPGTGKAGCPTSASQCQGGVVNVADYTTLNNVVATVNNGITCFSLATTLQNSRLAQMVFGPFASYSSQGGYVLTGDMTVGIFLDLEQLKNYIGCLSVIDSGSIGRYGDQDVRTPQAMKITSETLRNNYQGLLDDCASKDECGLFMAGCGGSQGANPSISQQGNGYNYVEEPFALPVYQGPEGGPWLPKGWDWLAITGTPGTVPFFPGTDKGLQAFEETLVRTQNIVGPQADPTEWSGQGHCMSTAMFNTPPGKPPPPPVQDPKPSYSNSCGDFWSYQMLPNAAQPANGYRENEVDLFVPQKPTAQPYSKRPNMNCVPDDSFVEAFRDAVVGIYATNYCAKDVKFTGANASTCCNLDISKKIAMAMAQKYNSTPGVKRKIDAWVWDVVDPTGKWTAPADSTKGRLNISLISGS